MNQYAHFYVLLLLFFQWYIIRRQSICHMWCDALHSLFNQFIICVLYCLHFYIQDEKRKICLFLLCFSFAFLFPMQSSRADSKYDIDRSQCQLQAMCSNKSIVDDLCPWYLKQFFSSRQKFRPLLVLFIFFLFTANETE